MLHWNEALDQLLAGVSPLPAEEVAVESAAGRVLAEDLAAAAPLPPFDSSAMDGYAVRSADVDSGGAELPVIGESRAGGPPPPPLPPGAACRIFTGAPLPEGADAVFAQEDVARAGDRVRFAAPTRPGRHVRRAGEDLARGALALARGTRLGPGQLALLCALDRARVTVHRRPRVALLTTGDELRAPGEPAFAGSIVDSNGPMTAALVKGCGAEVTLRLRVPDRLEDLRAAIRRAASAADVLLATGGVSVGEHDLVRAALEAEGAQLGFWKVAIKPGKPVASGRLGALRVLGLPGNPGAALVTFHLFAGPLLRALEGDAHPAPRWLAARLAHVARHATGRDELARAVVGLEEDGLSARLLSNQASGSVPTLAAANALALLPAARERFEPGETVRVLML